MSKATKKVPDNPKEATMKTTMNNYTINDITADLIPIDLICGDEHDERCLLLVDYSRDERGETLPACEILARMKEDEKTYKYRRVE